MRRSNIQGIEGSSFSIGDTVLEVTEAGLVVTIPGQDPVTIGATLSPGFAVLSATSEEPLSPDEGDVYIVPDGAGGAWDGHDGEVATRGASSWSFATPASGWLVLALDETVVYVRSAGEWIPIPVEGQAILDALDALGDANVLTDAQLSKLLGIENNATADQTPSEIRAAVAAADDSNVFTDADKDKLDGIEDGATADQSAAEILVALRTVDGSGSLLDADTLDGIQGAAFAQLASPTFTGTPAGPTATLGTNTTQLATTAFVQAALTAYAPADGSVTNAKLANMAQSTIKGRAASAGTGVATDLSATQVRTILNIEDGATADMSAAEILTAVKTVDGTGSGLDADTLDGLDSGDFLPIAGGTLTDDLTIEGTMTSDVVATDALQLAATSLLLNYGFSGSPSSNASIGVERGSGADALITWDESADQWSIDHPLAAPGVVLSADPSSGSHAARKSYNDARYLQLTGGALSGALTTSSTVDGRDVSVDGTKLDGIESGATADMTGSEILTALASVDGTGSGLDADLLDGQHASAFLPKSGGAMTGAITTSSTFDGRDVSVDGTKLDGIESGATGDMTRQEIADLLFGTGGLLDGTQDNIVVEYDSGGPVLNFSVDVGSDDNIQDTAWDVLTGTQSGITVSYDSGLNEASFVVASQTDNNFTNALKSKLDGIESGATADMSAAEILTAVKTVDGTGSGLDADTVDGVHADALAALASPTFTGTPAAPTAALDTNTTQLATTAFVQAALAGSIPPGAITNARMANMSAATIKGRASGAGTGDPTDLTAAQVRTIINVQDGATDDQTAAEILALLLTVDGGGSGLDADTLDGHETAYFAAAANAALTGTPTAPTATLGTNTTQLATTAFVQAALAAFTVSDATITNAKLADMAQSTIKGRASGGGTGAPGDLTAAQVRTIINVEDGATADMSAAEILTAVKTVDGTGSGLDADTLDGHETTYFAAAATTLTAGLGISGGGDLSANRTIAFDPSELVDTAVTSSDYVVVSDASAAGAPIKRLASSFLNDLGLLVSARTITAGTGLTGGGDLSADRTISVATAGIVNTLLANMSAATIKGRASGAGTGDPTDLTAAQVRTIINVQDGATDDQTAAEILTAIKTVDGTGSGLDADTVDGVHAAAFATLASPTFTGSPAAPTATPGTNTTQLATTEFVQTELATFTIASGSITNAKLANMAQSTIKGRASGAGTGAPVDLTAAQVRTIINVQDGATDDMTGSEILTALASVDGTGSGLDADTVDGINASDFALAAVTLTAGAGISGGGTLAADRTFAFDPSELTNTAATTSDYVVLSDASAAGAGIKRDVSSFVTDIGLVLGTRTLTAGLGISGGGTLAADRTFAFDPSELTNTAVTSSDSFVLSDASASDGPIRRTASSLISDLGIVLNTRSVASGTGLTGGGDLSADRTLAISISGLTASTTTVGADSVLFYDASAGDHKIRTWTDIISDLSLSTGGGAITSSSFTMATNRLLGRTTASTGAIEEISVGSGLTFSSGSLSANVTTVAGRTGAVTLSNTDISGLGTSATVNTGTSGATIPLLDGANTFSGATTVNALLDVQQDVRLSGDISPTQIAANQNDYNPTSLSTSSVLRLTSDASRDITGLQGGADGRLIAILNVGSNNIVLKDQSGSSTAAYRFSIGADLTLAAGQSIILWYDSTSSRWRPLGQSIAASGVTSGSYTNSSITVGVDGRITSASSASTTGSGSTVLATNPTLAAATMSGNLSLNGNWLSGDGGSEGIYIDSSGKVGVGTTVPGGALTGDTVLEARSAGTTRIQSRSTGQYAVFNLGAGASTTNTTAHIYLDNTANKMFVQSATATPLSIGVNSGDHIYIDTAGQVGVGTTTPNPASGGGKYLTVYHATSRGNVEMYTGASDADANLCGILGFGATTNTTQIGVAQIFGYTDGTTATNRGGRLGLYTKPNASATMVEHLQITEAGNVRLPSTPTVLTTDTVGFRGAPQNTQNGNYTLVLGDAGKHIFMTANSTYTYTVPPNASVAFPIGCVIGILNYSGSGTVSIAQGSGVTIYWIGTAATTGTRTLATIGYASLMKVNTNEWVIQGVNIT